MQHAFKAILRTKQNGLHVLFHDQDERLAAD
jgi:hypothetical protein